MARVRLIDIANAASVSMTTASYVLSGRDVSIPSETRERILEIARSLNYQPNRIARNLAQQRSGLIGVLTPINHSPFHAQLTGELNERAATMSYTLVFEPETPCEEGYQSAVNRLLQWRVDGLLLWCEDAVPSVKADCPTVFMGPFGDQPTDGCYIRVDLYAGARSAARYLVELGHRDICYVGRDNTDRDPRWKAILDVMTEAGLKPPCRLSGAKDLRSAATMLATTCDVPSAFFCISDVQAMSVFRGLRDSGLSIPEDASIVSCDESWVAENIDPPLTAVSVPFGQMAESALEMLVNKIRDSAVPSRQQIMVPLLRVRGSASAPKVREFALDRRHPFGGVGR